jgi:Mrp family chromosome partitioning ATPase
MPGYSEAKLFPRGGRGAVAAALASSWQIGLAILACALAIGIAVAYAMPSVYESTATIEVTADTEGGPSGRPAESEIKALLSDPARMERMLRDSPSRPQSGPSSESLESSAKVVAVTDRQFSVSYFASTPELGREGCVALTDAIVTHFTKRGARAELDKRTKALADFVNAHPGVLTEPPPRPSQSSSASKAQVPGVDAALEALKRQKATLESEVAAQSATDPSHANPYDEGAPSSADLQRQLAEVRYAITTRQKAIAAAASSGPSQTQTPAPPEQGALQTQYRALVRDVVEAEHPPARGPASNPARVVRAASLPDSPVKPNRPMIIGIGGLAGVWLSLLAVVLRFQHRIRRHPEDEEDDESPRREMKPAAPVPVAFQAPVARAGSSAPPPVRNTPQPPAPIAPARPVGAGGTQIGMMDPALVRTQMGGTPAGLMLLAAPSPEEAPKAEEPQAIVVETSSPEPPPVRALPAVAEQPPQTLRGIHRSPSDPPAQGPAAAEAPRVLIPRPHSSHPPPAQAGRSPSDAPAAPAAAKAALRPSAPPRTIDVFSPPETRDGPPDTQRMGTGQGSLGTFPKTISPPPPPPSVPPPRSENSGTRYSFVDRSRASRPPMSERPRTPSVMPLAERSGHSRPATGRAGTLVEVQDLADGNGSGTTDRASIPPPPPPVTVEERRASRAMQPVTNARPAEVWEKKASAPEPDEIVVSQPISTRWRMPAALSGGNGTLAGLRDQVLEFMSRGPFVIAVTGEQACVEAKTNVAARLSGMLSNEDRARVLLVEANFDFPALHRVLSVEMPPGSGFSQQLRSRLRNGRKPWSVVHCTTNLDVLAEGPVRSPGVLLSQEFANAIAELRTCYDVIVLDSPVSGQGMETKPINAVSDGIAIIAASQSVLKAALDRAMSRFGQKKLMVAIPASETT